MTLQAAIERLGNEIDLGNLTPQELAAILERERIVRMLARFGWNQCAAKVVVMADVVEFVFELFAYPTFAAAGDAAE